MHIKPDQHSWKVILTLALSLLLVSAAWVQGQSQDRPKPGPEQQKLALWVGDWQYEGHAKESAAGPAGKFSGKMTGRLILGGFFVELRGHETSPTGGAVWVETKGYDPVGKTYTGTGFASASSPTWPRLITPTAVRTSARRVSTQPPASNW